MRFDLPAEVDLVLGNELQGSLKSSSGFLTAIELRVDEAEKK